MSRGPDGEVDAPPPEPPQGVGKTALGVARVRALESQREDRLFDDPYAQAFVDAAPGAFPEERAVRERRAAHGPLASLGAAFSAHAVIRTRFYDDFLTAATAAGSRQVVLLAAGLDTRAFRLAWPAGTRVFELDLPGVLAFKEAVLGARGAVPRCGRVTVPADLREDWPARLTAAGFGPAEPATWLAEGLIIYLTAGEAGRLFSTVGDLSVPGGRLAFEHDPAGLDAMTARARQIPAMRTYTSLWKGGLGDPPRWLADHGWRPEFHGLAALGRSCRRPVPDSARSGFLTAVRVATVARGSSRPEPG
jgi:methyltransferase (TIGR00027 family)